MDITEFANTYYRAATDDIRFTLPALMGAFLPGAEWPSPQQRRVVRPWLTALGATCVGKSRVGHTNKMKDNVYSVPLAEWPGFCGLLATTPLPSVVAQPQAPKGPSTATRLARLEAQMADLTAAVLALGAKD